MQASGPPLPPCPLQAQVPVFKAQPLPAFDSVVLPEKKKLEATRPEPFRLLVDQRGGLRSSRLEKMVRPAPPPAPLPPPPTQALFGVCR